MEDKKGAKERLDAFTDFLRREERSICKGNLMCLKPGEVGREIP